jgi:hypothetical protein
MAGLRERVAQILAHNVEVGQHKREDQLHFPLLPPVELQALRRKPLADPLKVWACPAPRSRLPPACHTRRLHASRPTPHRRGRGRRAAGLAVLASKPAAHAAEVEIQGVCRHPHRVPSALLPRRHRTRPHRRGGMRRRPGVLFCEGPGQDLGGVARPHEAGPSRVQRCATPRTRRRSRLRSGAATARVWRPGLRGGKKPRQHPQNRGGRC